MSGSTLEVADIFRDRGMATIEGIDFASSSFNLLGLMALLVSNSPCWSILQTCITFFARSIPITVEFFIVWTPYVFVDTSLLMWAGGVHTSLFKLGYKIKT